MSNAIYYPPYYEKQYWWSFAHINGLLLDQSILVEDGVYHYTDTELYGCLEDIPSFISAYPSLVNNSKIIQPVVDIFNLLQKRFINHYIFSTSEVGITGLDEASKEAIKWLYKLFNVIEYTYKKYSKIIDLYNENYATLMRQLETTTESGSRFNDTPQQAEVSLSYEDNVYTTNLTKSKSVTSADSNTPIVKIEEIMRNYRNILLEWLNEFDSLFVEENNI